MGATTNFRAHYQTQYQEEAPYFVRRHGLARLKSGVRPGIRGTAPLGGNLGLHCGLVAIGSVSW
jgi:hypothetical protein